MPISAILLRIDHLPNKMAKSLDPFGARTLVERAHELRSMKVTPSYVELRGNEPLLPMVPRGQLI